MTVRILTGDALAQPEQAEPVASRPYHIGVQNDQTYIISGRAPALNNDYPNHEADRTCIAKVFDEGEAKRLVEMANRNAQPQDRDAVLPYVEFVLENIRLRVGDISKETQAYADAVVEFWPDIGRFQIFAHCFKSDMRERLPMLITDHLKREAIGAAIAKESR